MEQDQWPKEWKGPTRWTLEGDTKEMGRTVLQQFLDVYQMQCTTPLTQIITLGQQLIHLE